jgi:hypothetical protein
MPSRLWDSVCEMQVTMGDVRSHQIDASHDTRATTTEMSSCGVLINGQNGGA